MLHLYRLDEQYIVRDGKVMVVDEFTGRVMPDRSWGQGLHQMIEHKEGLELSDPRATLKSISYQRFFKHYLLLAGMTGTAAEIRAELGRVYNLPVVRIPTHRKSRRIHAPDSVHRTMADKWAAVRERCRALHARGVPVLIGTRSVAASEEVARVLAEAALPAVVLNAKQDADEAALVGRAGEIGSIMIATNMAGRGTDIPLSDAAREAGGLHVILTERHESARIDRQLEGRSGRQGDPGHAEAILSLEDAVLDSVRNSLWSRPMDALLAMSFPGWRAVAARWLRHAQARTERNWPANAAAWCPRTKNGEFPVIFRTGRLRSVEDEDFRRIPSRLPWPCRRAGLRRAGQGLPPDAALPPLTGLGAPADSLGHPMACLIEPFQVSELGSPSAGVLNKVLVQRGDEVRKGQVVAELNTNVDEATLQLRRAEAAYLGRVVGATPTCTSASCCPPATTTR